MASSSLLLSAVPKILIHDMEDRNKFSSSVSQIDKLNEVKVLQDEIPQN